MNGSRLQPQIRPTCSLRAYGPHLSQMPTTQRSHASPLAAQPCGTIICGIAPIVRVFNGTDIGGHIGLVAHVKTHIRTPCKRRFQPINYFFHLSTSLGFHVCSRFGKTLLR